MTQTEALKLALEALKTEQDIYREHDEDGAPEYILEAITAIKEALMSLQDGAQPAVEEQHKQRSVSEHLEPVAFVKGCNRGQWEIFPAKAHQIFGIEQPLYTTSYVATPRPPVGFAVMQKPWVGLTDEEIEQCQQGSIYYFYRGIEAKLREKNSL